MVYNYDNVSDCKFCLPVKCLSPLVAWRYWGSSAADSSQPQLLCPLSLGLLFVNDLSWSKCGRWKSDGTLFIPTLKPLTVTLILWNQYVLRREINHPKHGNVTWFDHYFGPQGVALEETYFTNARCVCSAPPPTPQPPCGLMLVNRCINSISVIALNLCTCKRTSMQLTISHFNGPNITYAPFTLKLKHV